VKEKERVCPKWKRGFGRNQNAGDVLSVFRMQLFMSLAINNTSQPLTNGASQKPGEVNQQLLSRAGREVGHKKAKQFDQEDTASLWQKGSSCDAQVYAGNHKTFPS